jgi:hypothetical protein
MPHGFVTNASFVSWALGNPGVSTTTTVGACAVTVYTTLATTNSPPVDESAGMITVTGGSQPVSLVPDATGKYTSANGGIDLFTGGEMITVTAAGATVPAFTATLVAPAPINLTAPAQPTSGPLLVDRTKDLVFTWMNGGVGTVMVSLAGTGGPASMSCTFPSAAGTGTIPQAALATLPPSSKGPFGIGATSAQLIDTGGWKIAVFVGDTLIWNGAVNTKTFSYQAIN